MSVRVQVILDEKEAARFRSQAMKQSKSLSAWLRDAGRKMFEDNLRGQALTDKEALEQFFQKCNEREEGIEPDWQEQKKLIEEGFLAGKNV